MALLMYLLPWMGCLHLALLYPTGEDTSPLISRYGLQLVKKDVIVPFQDPLLSAFLMTEMKKESQKQRKKAVDSTFIRFGRSSRPGSGQHADESTPVEEMDYVSKSRRGPNNNERMSYGNMVTSSSEVEETLPEILSPPDSSFENIPSGYQYGCRLTSNGDFVRALIVGSPCIRISQKVKRENVNDTFIRFGKRDSSRNLDRSSNAHTRHDT